MTETNGTNRGRRLAVYAIPESKEGEKKAFWPKIGAAFTNRDGSIAILLEALPLGTNRLQIREIRDDARAGAARRAEIEAVEVAT